MGINTNYPSIPMLRQKARRRIPGFALDYLENGCNNEVNLRRNTDDIREIQLKPYYLREFERVSLETKLFGKTYAAPFGICPIGLQGMIWPGASEILAKAAFEKNIPFILSTVATASLEKIAEITEGNAWFQLYNPVESELRDDMLRRCDEAGYDVLVLLSDVPTFGHRPNDIKNGLTIPPKMTFSNIWQMMGKPRWAMETLAAGAPKFASLKPYLPPGIGLRRLGEFMDKTFDGRLNEEKIKPIRDLWKGKLVIKGVETEEDTEKAIKLGFDGIIVSNHGGRQLDPGESTIRSTIDIVKKFKGKTTIMMDSGIRSGPDIACTLACGADFALMGRAFMYGVGALGKHGGEHTIELLKLELSKVMEQLCCQRVEDLPEHLVSRD